MEFQYEWDKHFNDINYGVPGAADGIPYVPRDNFPVRLHEGDLVLTAQKMRQQRTGTSGIFGANTGGSGGQRAGGR